MFLYNYFLSHSIMKLYIMRHGQTFANVERKPDCNPEDSTSLTELGQEQSIANAEKLKDVKFDAIFVSQFIRTKETASIVNEFHNLPLIVDKRINETNSGLDIFTKKQQQDFFDKEGIESYKTRGWDKRFFDGETITEEYNRLTNFIEELKNKDYKNVLIVSHGEPIQLMIGYLTKANKKEMTLTKYIDNATHLIFKL